MESQKNIVRSTVVTPKQIMNHHAMGPLVRAAMGLARDIGTSVWVMNDRISLIVPERNISFVCVGFDEIILNGDTWKRYTVPEWYEACGG
jgi:hypothetical protein